MLLMLQQSPSFLWNFGPKCLTILFFKLHTWRHTGIAISHCCIFTKTHVYNFRVECICLVRSKSIISSFLFFFAQQIIPVFPIGLFDSLSVGFQIGKLFLCFLSKEEILRIEVKENGKKSESWAVNRARGRSHHVMLVSKTDWNGFQISHSNVVQSFTEMDISNII